MFFLYTLCQQLPMKYVHTNIIARDWQRLVMFYQTVFACQPLLPQRDLAGEWLDKGTGVASAHLRGVHLRLPGWGNEGPTLEIYQYDEMAEKGEPLANRLGFGHIAFLVDDVAAVREKVLQNGGRDLGQIAQTIVPGVGHLTFTYMTDPEGNILEIQHWA